MYHLSDAEVDAFNAREKGVYEGASAVFTFSELLRKSFIDDYGLPCGKVLTAYAGPNIHPSLIPQRQPRRGSSLHQPSVLFIGKEFLRKGGYTLLQAFSLVRRDIPNARLVIVGPSSPPSGTDDAGTEFLGLLRRDLAADFGRLLAVYRDADVFCLPSVLDPFPSVLREAMFISLPCVTTDIWALPEMVLHGLTGFTVPPGDPVALANRIRHLLRNPEEAAQMGIKGSARAEAHFTWAATAEKIHGRIQEVVAGTW